jgi:RecB family endonuclease NucS
MPIKTDIWKVAQKPEQLPVSKLVSEKLLEDMIAGNPNILSAGWMLIGRQERTSFGGMVDLLAIAPDGSLVLIPNQANSVR